MHKNGMQTTEHILYVVIELKTYVIGLLNIHMQILPKQKKNV